MTHYDIYRKHHKDEKHAWVFVSKWAEFIISSKATFRVGPNIIVFAHPSFPWGETKYVQILYYNNLTIGPIYTLSPSRKFRHIPKYIYSIYKV